MSLQHPRKIVSLAVMACFFGLVYLSALPVQAASAPAREETVSPVDSQTDLPGAVEKTGSTAPKKKGSPIIPIIIGVVAVGAIAAVLVLVVFKSYDIRGTWNVNGRWSSGVTFSVEAIFVGDKKSGIVEWVIITGNYTVDGKKVTWSISLFGITATYTGEFKDKDTIEGTISNTLSESGTFTAVRIAEAAAHKKQAAAAGSSVPGIQK